MSEELYTAFFPKLLEHKYYNLQGSLWEEVLAHYIENNGAVSELGVDIRMDDRSIDLMRQLGFLEIPSVVDRDGRFGEPVKPIAAEGLTLIDLSKKDADKAASLKLGLLKDAGGRDIFSSMAGTLEIPAGHWTGTVVFVVDVPSVIKIVDGKPELTLKGIQVAAQVQDVLRLQERIGRDKANVKFAFVNLKERELPVTQEQIISELLRGNNELYGALVRLGEVKSDVARGADVIKSITDRVTGITAASQIVFVNDSQDWVRQFMEIVKGVLREVILEEVVSGVSPELVQQSLTEAFWLVIASGGDAEKMPGFVTSVLKENGVSNEYIQKLMPKKNANGTWSVPPAPRKDKIDELKLKEGAEVSA